MLNQHVVREKILNLKGGMKSLWDKFHHKTEMSGDAKVENSGKAQDLVWENENASMQDKSYSFDEVTTDANYDTEDDLNFADEDGPEGSESRYK